MDVLAKLCLYNNCNIRQNWLLKAGDNLPIGSQCKFFKVLAIKETPIKGL